MIWLGLALGAQQFGECLRVLQEAEDFGFSADYGEIAWSQDGKVGFGAEVRKLRVWIRACD